MYNIDSLNFYGDNSLRDTLVTNVISFLQEGLLQVGAFYNIAKDQTGYNGVDLSRLWPTAVSGTNANTIYKGIKPSWVWESGLQLKYAGGIQPTIPSGLYINDTFYTTGFPGTGFYIDYSRGRAVFSSQLPPTYKVQAAYSVRMIDVLDSDTDLYRRLNSEWRQNLSASGRFDNNLYAYLPAIFVDVDNYKSIPRELGSRNKMTRARIEFTWFTNDGSEFNKIADALYMLESKSWDLYAISSVPKPLNYLGQRVSGHLIPSYLSSNWPDGRGRFMENFKMEKIKNTQILPLRKGRAIIDLEVEVFPIT